MSGINDKRIAQFPVFIPPVFLKTPDEEIGNIRKNYADLMPKIEKEKLCLKNLYHNYKGSVRNNAQSWDNEVSRDYSDEINLLSFKIREICPAKIELCRLTVSYIDNYLGGRYDEAGNSFKKIAAAENKYRKMLQEKEAMYKKEINPVLNFITQIHGHINAIRKKLNRET